MLLQVKQILKHKKESMTGALNLMKKFITIGLSIKDYIEIIVFIYQYYVQINK